MSPSRLDTASNSQQLDVVAKRFRPLETIALRSPLPPARARAVANLSKPARERTIITRKSRRQSTCRGTGLDSRPNPEVGAGTTRSGNTPAFPSAAARVPCAEGERLLVLGFVRQDDDNDDGDDGDDDDGHGQGHGDGEAVTMGAT